jgi:glycosyltransferase involved in cell wall biosynthesis
MISICHISTVHTRFDVRIFHKQCKSLSKIYEVNYIVADGKGDEIADGIKIFDVGLRQNNRLKRASIDSRNALRKALSLNCEIYHIHDPELLSIAIKLKKQSKKVIYDAHEDLPQQIYSKPYLKEWTKYSVSKFVEFFENRWARRMNYIFTATPFIRDRFKLLNENTLDINNFPVLGELSDVKFSKKRAVCYTGGITAERGIHNIVNSMLNLDIELILAGAPDSELYLNSLKNSESWSKVDYRGLVNRLDLSQIMNESMAGIVTFLPYPNHINAQPNKIFEYMSAGIPVIGSNFPLWREIIEGNNCGICVDPESTDKISAAIKKLVNNPELAKTMGLNGVRAVENKYNWGIEENKLLRIYKIIEQS